MKVSELYALSRPQQQACAIEGVAINKLLPHVGDEQTLQIWLTNGQYIIAKQDQTVESLKRPKLPEVRRANKTSKITERSTSKSR